MTRILHVVHGLSRGGLENGVINLLNHLPHPEFEQGVACLDNRGEMADRISRDVELFVLDRGYHDLKVPFRLARIMRDWRPDIIHCRNWNTWMDTVAAHLIAARPGTLVWSFHGFADGHRLPGRRAVASRALALFTRELFAVCRDSARRYAALSGIDPGRFQVIYNGVDTARFHPTDDKSALRDDLGIAKDAVVLMTVASLTPVKDHESILRALAFVKREKKQVAVLFIGDGPLRPRLEETIRELDLGQIVQMPGNSDRVPELLAAADLFILPSILEGMSNAILEAMASGLPVIANRVGGNPELVIDGQTGLLCEQGDIERFSNAIRTLLQDEPKRSAMAQAARRRALEEFSIQTMMKNYAAYYRKVAGK